MSLHVVVVVVSKNIRTRIHTPFLIEQSRRLHYLKKYDLLLHVKKASRGYACGDSGSAKSFNTKELYKYYSVISILQKVAVDMV